MRKTPKLGQHFLRNTRVADILTRASGASAGETVLEIGPGGGILTRTLVASGAHVIAVEKDSSLVAGLRASFAREIGTNSLVVKEADIRDVSPETLGLADQAYILAANIPYYITGEIIRTFLTSVQQPKTIALLIQKEVAERIVSKTESMLSLSVKAYGAPSIVAKVPRGDFSPPPSVDSAILRIGNISRDFFSDMREEVFFNVVRAGFSAKRKKLMNNLSTTFDKERVRTAFTACNIPENARAETVPLASWKRLTQSLT